MPEFLIIVTTFALSLYILRAQFRPVQPSIVKRTYGSGRVVFLVESGFNIWEFSTKEEACSIKEEKVKCCTR